MKNKTATEKTTLEREYETIMKNVGERFVVSENESLEQPTPYRVVQTVTTYSAYEEPI